MHYKNLFYRLASAIEQGAKESETRMISFGIFGLFAYLIYYLINLYLLPTQSYENLWPRIVISTLCLFLIFKNYWPKRLRSFLPVYWCFTLLYSMPFFITFMVLKNNGASAWVFNLLSVTVLMMLLVDWITYIVLFIVGVLLALLTYYLTTKTPFTFIPGTMSYRDILNTFAISLIMGVIFSRKRQQIEEEKLEAMKLLSANMAHELRTPLAAINASAGGLKEYLPELIKTYDIAKEKSLPIPYIRSSQFNNLNLALEHIEAETKYANTIINMLLINVDQSKIKFKNFEICSIAHCVEEALNRYPFLPEERSFVHWKDGDDFIFKGDQLLTIHILFNLLKNALFYIKGKENKQIKIWVEKGTQYNKLHFLDTGAGIPASILPRIFDRFFTKTYHGSGVGLAFCKMVMESYEGVIGCNSIEGKYTEFILSFPTIQNVVNPK